MPGTTVHVNYATPRRGIPSAASFRHWVAASLHAVGANPASEMSIRIVAAAEARTLNRRYRHKDYATNVLSFAADLPDGITLPLLGDLVICAPVVQREAREQGKPERDHWAHMTVHGTLHLLGHDHTQADEAERMESLERRILAEMEIPNPYA